MKTAVFFVVNQKFADVAFAQAARIARCFGVDVHIFEESETGVDLAGYSNLPNRVSYHHNLLSRHLPTGLPSSEKWPAIIYMRLFAPQFLKHYDRVIYLDADIYVKEMPDLIWSIDLPAGLGAVHDCGVVGKYLLGTDIETKQWLSSIGLEGSRYLNSGVLVIDVKKWLEIDFVNELKSHHASFGQKTRMFDQDFLNFVFRNRWTELSPCWNFQYPILNFGFEETFRPCFYHFTNYHKPWGREASPYHPSYRALYVEAFSAIGLERAIDGRSGSGKSMSARGLKQALRQRLSNLGWPSSRERRKRTAWSQQLAEYEAFYLEALEQKRFADLDVDTLARAPVELTFDGRDLISPLYGSDRGAS